MSSYYYTCVRVKEGGEISDDFGTFGRAFLKQHNTITNTVIHRSAASKVVRR